LTTKSKFKQYFCLNNLLININIVGFVGHLPIRLIYQKLSYKPEKLQKINVVIYILGSHNIWQISIDGGFGLNNFIGFCCTVVSINSGYHINLMIANVAFIRPGTGGRLPGLQGVRRRFRPWPAVPRPARSQCRQTPGPSWRSARP